MNETLQEIITSKMKEVIDENSDLILSELPELPRSYPAARNGKWVMLPREKLTLTDRRRVGESLQDNEAFTLARLQHALLQRTAFDLETIKLHAKENPPG